LRSVSTRQRDYIPELKGLAERQFTRGIVVSLYTSLTETNMRRAIIAAFCAALMGSVSVAFGGEAGFICG
jgi:hypothetical protein